MLHVPLVWKWLKRRESVLTFFKALLEMTHTVGSKDLLAGRQQFSPQDGLRLQTEGQKVLLLIIGFDRVLDVPVMTALTLSSEGLKGR